MKRILLCLLTSVLLCGGQAYSQGQSIPLLLTVKKKENTESNTRTTTGYYYNYTSKSGVQTLAYTVDVMNASTASVIGLQVRWTIVLKDPNSGQLKLVEGKKNTDLARGQKYSFDTDIIELGQFYQDNWSSSKTGLAEAVGYLVECIVDGKVVSSATQPSDIRTKVSQARANADQKRHRF